MDSFELDMNNLVSSGPAAIRSWLRDLRLGKAEAPREWSLLGLAQSAATHARSELDLDWLQVAVELFEELAGTGGEREREANLLASMHLRAYFIVKTGADPSNPLLDPGIIVEWFRRMTPLRLDEVADKAAHWSDLDIEEIRRLRDIKNRLAVFEQLKKKGVLSAYPDIRDWLSIRGHLP